MRLILAAAISLAFTGAAMAQTTKPMHHMARKSHAMHAMHAMHAKGRMMHSGMGQASGQRPLDVGPNTPSANAAYQGGGVVLQGAPGAPAPTPMATPPGQVPANSVPVR